MKSIQNRLDFLDYLKDLKGYSDLTVKTYNEAIKEMFKHTKEPLIREDGAYVINLMPYRMYIASNNSKTITKKLSAIRAFVKYLDLKKIKVILENDSSISVAKTLPKPLSEQNITDALNVADEQERLILLLFYTLGVRISELSSLELSNIDEKWIRVKGKGNKERDVPILKNIGQMLEIYIKNSAPNTFLFEKNGEKLSENSLRYIITKLFKKVGIKATPHQLRHSYATGLLNAGARISDVSELLGHSSMATTQIYTKLGNPLKLDNYLSSHPLCKVDVENS